MTGLNGILADVIEVKGAESSRHCIILDERGQGLRLIVDATGVTTGVTLDETTAVAVRDALDRWIIKSVRSKHETLLSAETDKHGDDLWAAGFGRTTRMRDEHNLHDYWVAPGSGPLHPEWDDKPHRLLYDLIGEILHLRAALAEVTQASVTEAAKVESLKSALQTLVGPNGSTIRFPFYEAEAKAAVAALALCGVQLDEDAVVLHWHETP